MDQYQYPSATRNITTAPSAEKSSQLLLREYPHRAIAIATPTHALIFRYSTTTSEAIANGSLTSVSSARPRAAGDGPVPKCMVEFSPVSKQLLSDFRPLTPRPIYGTLGLISIGQDVFLCVITQALRVATLRPGETVEKIASVDFFCLNSSEYDNVISLNTYDSDPSDSTSPYGQNLSRREGEIEYPYQELQKLLGNGSFYYSTDFDLTNRLQDRFVSLSDTWAIQLRATFISSMPIDSDTFDIDNFDDSFLWNYFMISPLVQFRSRLLAHEREALDASRILTSAIRGFCLTMTIPQSTAPLRDGRSGLPSFLTVISRLSCKRAGTRFNSRGIDDDGHVANFVETETIYWSPSGVLFSYAQVRGSVPVFWEQTPGLIPGQQKITITRSADGTQPAFDKHFEELEQSYGAVHIVNLLSATKPGEAELTHLFHYGLQHCSLGRVDGKQSSDHALLRETDYDFHAETKTAGYDAAREIRRYIEHSADGFAYYLAELTDDMIDVNEPTGSQRMVVVLQQEGVFRTNCLDCLDRTNLIQTIISQLAVEAFLGHRGEFAASDFWMRHSTLWADNGDALSRIYAGTGALKSSFTRHGKMSLAGAFADARKSATRLYINNFADKARQNTIDMLLGRLVGQTPVHLFDPISDFISAELSKRSSEYSSTENITIWVGTFNLNGRTNGIDEDLSPWICPQELGSTQPEIVTVGFQEIVELSAQQIMNSDPTRKQLWEKAIKKTLNNRTKQLGGEKYVLLRSGQLVGAALCIFVKASVLPKIKNVEGSVKKTGMSGIAGNKGAVAIRMEYANTQICFVTAHLAAGFSNYDERNKDYATIHHGLRFQRNRGIDDHDTVIWMGDFNYRIGLSHERVVDLIQKNDLERLYENDQLNLQMVAGLSFPYYSEARITFMPTYKFDVGTDRYDTSEKLRIPAWTDRILRKGTNIRQLSYNSAPLRFSDHRPVFATFQCTVNIVNEAHRERISRELYDRRKAEVGHTAASLISEDSEDDEDLIGYDPIEPGLPPASSDRQRWWLESGKMAKSTVGPPKASNGNRDVSSVVLNSHRPSNPFTPTEEPDWVAVPRSNSRLSSFSSISSSPYEHINHSTILSTSVASNSSPRKLPPPFDPATLPAKVGQINLLDEQVPMQRSEVPPPPPPRRQTSTSLIQSSPSPASSDLQPTLRPSKTIAPHQQIGPVSSSPRVSNGSKAPPPIARKPAHLTSTSPTSSPSLPETSILGSFPEHQTPKRPIPRKTSTTVSNLTSQLQASRSGALTGGMLKTTSPPLRLDTASNNHQTGTSGPTGQVGRVSLPGLGNIERKPALPTRPIQQHTQQPQSNIDLLGDDGSEINGWETLKPS
ncbi:SacI homology domain-containing protein [Hypoxylon trugodes]|uniref:SacI homology domain-containing protein n=1 Tax=Hypoxylon trugodes TaxID=326681 RepID=UPI00218FA231|nr:SacI homology domain-containing protein [Hypoxylon trugodes]KAI1385048.1 SacI homology domain-containing protein [Hypoxylon trugodes]